jgi:phenylpropionate dioxygenase-like ring-hydroxylating dioxygenase large terminal subunit
MPDTSTINPVTDLFPGFGRAADVNEPDDVLDPKHFAAVRSQDGRTRAALPLWAFTSERYFAAEMERLLLPGWLMLARTELVAKPGDFHCLTFMNIPLMLVHGSDGRVRVFANTCRHRGALVAEGSGNCKTFRCPYHAWVYSNEGDLLAAPHYPDLDGKPIVDGSNRREYGLLEIPSDIWGGFIFVRFRESAPEGVLHGVKPAAPTLAEHLGELPRLLGSHRLEDMVTTRKLVFEMDANWKCFVENYSDGYHIPTVHKDSLAQWKSTYVDFGDPGPNVTSHFASHDGSQLLLPFPGFEGFPAMEQIDADKKRGTFFVTIRPLFMMTLGNDGALVFNSEPLSATKSRLTVSSLFPKSTVARNDFEELAKNYYRRNDMVVGEDVAIALRQYAGIRSPYAHVAPLCQTETNLNTIANWILDRVIGPAQ